MQAAMQAISCTEVEYSLCKEHNVNLHRHDYNEPQKGKDQADRKSVIAKKDIREKTLYQLKTLKMQFWCTGVLETSKCL